MLSCGHLSREGSVAAASLYLCRTNCNLNILERRQVIICIPTTLAAARRRIWTIFRCIIFSVFRFPLFSPSLLRNWCASLHSKQLRRSRSYRCCALRIAFYCIRTTWKSSVAVGWDTPYPTLHSSLSLSRCLPLSISLGQRLPLAICLGAINSIKMQFEGFCDFK